MAPTSDYVSEEKENPPRTLDYMQMEGMGHIAHVETKIGILVKAQQLPCMVLIQK